MKNTAKKGLPVSVLAAIFMGGALIFCFTLASCDLIDNIIGSDDSDDDTDTIYTVSFSVNGGAGNVPTTKIVTAGYSMRIPDGNGLYRRGYVFGGWNTNSSGSGINYPAESYLTPTTSIVLYAKWNYSSGIIPDDEIDDILGLDDKLEWLHANVQRGGNYIIELWSNESTGLVNLSFGSRPNVTITVRGVRPSRTISLSSNGSIFHVGRGVTLILENITLRGRGSNSFPLVFVEDGTLIMRNGTSIINNNSHGVEVDGGSFIMDGGTISGNTAIDNGGGGGVLVRNGTFTMNGGTISGNIADWGGGVLVYDGAFTMNFGTITGNRAYQYGGGVLVYGGSFTKFGGTITGHTDQGNGNVVMDGSGTVLDKLGHAVYAYSNSGVPKKTRDATAGWEVRLVYNSNGIYDGDWDS